MPSKQIAVRLPDDSQADIEIIRQFLFESTEGSTIGEWKTARIVKIALRAMAANVQCVDR